jgi:hypothetical protein
MSTARKCHFSFFAYQSCFEYEFEFAKLFENAVWHSGSMTPLAKTVCSVNDNPQANGNQWWALLHDVVTALQLSCYFLRLKQ